MIHYECKAPGLWHEKNNIPCQDSFDVRINNNGYIIAAVSDGIGSEKHSDIGSDIASRIAVSFCAEQIHEDMAAEKIQEVMYNAFDKALNAVWDKASSAEDDDDKDPNEYDTTLCLAIYDGEHLYYGQSGDSGMVVLLENGEYHYITIQQRNADGQVFPLSAGPEKWEFGSVDLPVSGVLLITDGVLDLICPMDLRNKEQKINIPLAKKLLDWFECDEADKPKISAHVQKFVDEKLRYAANDDTTVVVVINEDRKPALLDDSYYLFPDLATRRDEITKELEARQAAINKKYENIHYGKNDGVDGLLTSI